jgi:indole-3-glycerol phosphate synthase
MENYTILEKIVDKKKVRLSERAYKPDIKRLYTLLENDDRASFYEAIKKPGLSIIGEIKKASPSRGLIKPDFKPVELAQDYAKCVEAISVLTEEDFFQGSGEYLKAVHKAVKLPIIRKDFVISHNQILEAAELGASAVLLITAILREPRVIGEFLDLAHSVGLDCLVEVHNKEELDVALESGARIIGVNNRNLHDFTEDIYTTVRLRELIPADRLVVGESSIHTAEDIKILAKAGVDGILVGESFMRSGDIVAKAKEFKDAYEGSN